jgi:hypothetical protein
VSLRDSVKNMGNGRQESGSHGGGCRGSHDVRYNHFEYKLLEDTVTIVANRSVLGWAVVVAWLGVGLPVGARQQNSAGLAANLASLMGARQLDAVAAEDPEAPQRFVAALFIPNAQLLVVSAQYPAAAELQAQLAQQNYRDVYTALHQPAAEQTRFFLMDAGGDGLRSDDESVDVLYEKGTIQTLFDGRWKPQGLSEAAYRKRAHDAEARYSRLLSILTSALQTKTAAKAP